MTVVLVALAGGLGAAARYLVDDAVASRQRGSTPLGTIVVNVTACLLLGVLTGWGLRTAEVGTPTAVLGAGFLGGYSTFSTAGVETARLLLARRPGAAVGHALAMLVLSLAAAVVGVAIGQG